VHGIGKLRIIEGKEVLQQKTEMMNRVSRAYNLELKKS
jgi:hypothetical protein